MAGEEIEELVRCSQSGDREAFERLYRIAWPGVWASVRGRIPDADEARGIAQDAFLQAWRDLPALRDPARFAGWVRMIALHEAQSRLRARPAPVADPALDERRDPAAPDPAREAESRELKRALDGALLELPEEGREAVLLFLVEGLRYREVAERLGMTYDRAKGLIARGVAKVGSKLGRFVRGEESR